jgi:hypothetical protein
VKDRTLIYLSLALSVAALAYAIWIHQHAKQMAAESLQRRELEFVTHYAPKVREILSGLLEDTNIYASEPKTLEDLFRPFTETLNRIGSGTNHPAQETPK